jgi:hypothetical protein
MWIASVTPQRRLGLITFVRKIVIERCGACEPRIAQSVSIDEMEMRVDDRRVHPVLPPIAHKAKIITYE